MKNICLPSVSINYLCYDVNRVLASTAEDEHPVDAKRVWAAFDVVAKETFRSLIFETGLRYIFLAIITGNVCAS